MKYLLLFSISFLALDCFAQSDTAYTKHSHRLSIDPTQIITGQYTIAYGFRFHERNWIEATIGYQYLPNSISKIFSGSPQGGGIIGIIYADPSFGIAFKGPVAALSYAYSHKYNSRNYTRFVFSYQHLHHDPDCYYQGEEADEFTYSSKKTALGGEVLFSHALGPIRHHVFSEVYIGGGLHYTFGTVTKYYHDEVIPYYYFLCVTNIHDPNVSTAVENKYSIFPMFQVGFRILFRFGHELTEKPRSGPIYGKP